MCVAFDVKDVCEFVFSREDDTADVHELDKSVIRTFCSVLEHEITGNSERNPHYKYVFFSWDDESVESFFDANRGRFLDFGSTVVFAEECSTETADMIERKYNDVVVTDALRKARSYVRRMIQSNRDAG